MFSELLRKLCNSLLLVLFVKWCVHYNSDFLLEFYLIMFTNLISKFTNSFK